MGRLVLIFDDPLIDTDFNVIQGIVFASGYSLLASSSLFKLSFFSLFFCLFLRDVPCDELDSLERVEREEEAKPHILHRRVRYLEQEDIVAELLQGREWLQFLKLGRFLELECLEATGLGGKG